MALLTYITQAEIRDAADELDGKILTRPALLVTDGANLIYAVDVDIGAAAPLKNVPIARGNRDLLYADAGNACRLRRSMSGQYEVIGFSKELPGRYVRIPVDLSDLTLGPVEDISITARPLTLGDLADFGGFGRTPLGAVAIFRGGSLLELRIP
jgi:hypothetical protein